MLVLTPPENRIGKNTEINQVEFFFLFKKLSSITNCTHNKGLQRDERR